MAESLSEAGKTLSPTASAEGGKISINVSTDNVEVAIQLCKTATTLGALYVGYQLTSPIVKTAVKKALGGDRDDQGDPDIKPGSLHVLLHCFTDERFREVLADYESGRMKERLQEEFSIVGIKVEGLKVEIENMADVNKTKEAINKRHMAKVKKTMEAINKRSTMTTSDEERRWLVTGLGLTKVLTPALRDVLKTEVPKWYNSLRQPPAEIDKQVYGRHQEKLVPSKLTLNYKNVNNNDDGRKPKAFDYAVKDPLSLARLFVQPFMSKFTGFDQTMDISAVLSIICEAAPFTGAADHAKTVRSDIRNEWAHCNFANWTDEKFEAAFQSMEKLLKNVNLSTEQKQKLCGELNEWKDKGMQLCFGQPVDTEILTLLRSKVDELYKDIKTWGLEKEEQRNQLLFHISNIQTNMSKDIEDLRTRVDENELGIKRLNNELTESNKKIKLLNDDRFKFFIASTATNQLGIKGLNNQLSESNKKIKLIDDKFTTELSRYRIKEKEKIPYVFLAPPRNRYFSGRKKEIAELRRTLKVEETMNEKKIRVAAVCGLGGIGKTSLVSEYAHQMKDFYKGGVYWFSAEDDTFLENTVNIIASKVDALLGSFDITLSNILKKLSSLTDPSFIVLDCVDQDKLSSNTMRFLSLPLQENIFGHFLILTRRKPERLVNEVSIIEKNSCLRLECFQPQEAREFLLSRSNVNCHENAKSVAESLCKELGRLPLALEQAGAYINMLNSNLSLYLEQYKAERFRLLNQQEACPVAPGNESPDRIAVHTTWLINIDYIKKKANGPAAVRVMNAISFFNGNEIEKDLINVGTPEVEDEEYHKCVSSPLGRCQILKLLTDFSLFTYVNNAQSIRAHRLVLELVHERLDEKSKAEAFFDAVQLLSFALSKSSSPSNHVSFDDDEDVPDSPSHFYMWSKLCIHGYHLCRNMENLLESADLDLAFFPETAKILYECAVYLSANYKQEEAKRTLNFAYRVLDWTPLEGYEKIVQNLSSDSLFPLPIPLPEIFQVAIKKYCKPSDSLQPLLDDFGSETTSFVVPEADVPASEANDVAAEVVELALVASDSSLEKNVEKLELDGNKFLEEGSYNEALNTYSSAINLAQDCKQSFNPLLLANRASVYVALKQYEEALKDANDYIKHRPNCWKGYAWKALALDGINKKSNPDFVEKASAEIAAALALYRNENVFSDLPVFEVFGYLKKRIFMCDSVDKLLNAIFSEGNETGEFKILVLGSEEYIFDSNSVADPWNNCILVGARKNCSVSVKSNHNINLSTCMLTNLSFSFNKNQLYCLPGSFVQLLNCNFSSTSITNDMAAVETEGELSAEQCSFTGSYFGLLSTGSGKTCVTDCSAYNNTGDGLKAWQGGKIIVKNSRIFNNGGTGLVLAGAAPQCCGDNCFIHHNGVDGIYVDSSNKFTVKSNKVFHNGLHGINVIYSEGDIRENDAFDNGGWGIRADENSSVTITMNNVLRNKFGGINVEGEDQQLGLVNRNKIYNNLGPGFLDMSFSPEEHSPQSQDNEIYNNKETGVQNLSIPFCSKCRKSCELKKCEKCFTAAYCSKSCQESHSPRHEKICKVLREKLSHVVTIWKTAEYSKETRYIEGFKDVGPKFSPPPPRDGKLFVAKVHHVDGSFPVYSVILYDRSLKLYVKFDSKYIYQLLTEFGVLCENLVVVKKLFFRCFFDDNGKLRLFTSEFAEFQNW